ncbi:MAG: hypothetical protein NTV05_16045 [Acidobacteria bacterium]|nr:hypothetical protein [Acidobacteriota bacterium]
MWIDIPTAGARLQPLRIAGWAIDLAAPTRTGIATVTLDGEGRVRHVVCRGPWTGLERSPAVLGTSREGVAMRLAAAQARFGGGRDADVTAEARRLLQLHGVAGARIDTAALEDVGDHVVWVTHGATEAGAAVAVHLEPLTGRLIAWHVGGER